MADVGVVGCQGHIVGLIGWIMWIEQRSGSKSQMGHVTSDMQIDSMGQVD